MDKEAILNELRSKMVILFELDPESIQLEASLFQDLDLDSIDAIDLVVELQKLTGRKIQPADFKQIRTVGDLVTAVDELMNAEL